MDKMLYHDDDFLLNLFNAMPLPVMVVDSDVRILFGNTEALKLTGNEPAYVYRKRGGEALHCLHAKDASGGCGRSEFCEKCVIRNSVKSAMCGNRVYRKITTMELLENDRTTEINLLVTASPFIHKEVSSALLILENISEIIQMRSLLPICSVCKKIRDDKDYWENIEGYLSERLDIFFSHSLCPECAKTAYPHKKKSVL